MMLGSQNLPKGSSLLAGNDLHRAADIGDSSGNSYLRVEFSQPVITTSTGKALTVPFKKYDYRARLSLSTSNIFDYLQTEQVTLPSDASDISYTVSITTSQPDTLSTGKLNTDKKTNFTSVDAGMVVNENAAPVLTAHAASLSDAKGLLALTKTFSFPVTSFRGKTISFEPQVKLAGPFDEKNLVFSLVNISYIGSGSSTQPPSRTAAAAS